MPHSFSIGDYVLVSDRSVWYYGHLGVIIYMIYYNDTDDHVPVAEIRFLTVEATSSYYVSRLVKLTEDEAMLRLLEW